MPIENYIVDFYCHELTLAIEIDGSSHDAANDIQRQETLEKLGVKFIRFNDHTVKRDMTSVLIALVDRIRDIQQQRT